MVQDIIWTAPKPPVPALGAVVQPEKGEKGMRMRMRRIWKGSQRTTAKRGITMKKENTMKKHKTIRTLGVGMKEDTTKYGTEKKVGRIGAR